MNPRAMAAIEGARIGATIGMPFRGAKSFKRIHFYEPIPARQSSSETIDAWLIFANAVRQGLEPQDASQMIAKHWSYTTNESAFAKRNWQLGFLAPASGYFDNPLAMGSQALGRSVFWGVVNAGDPNRASEFAYYDAASDHSGTGVIAAVVLARMAAIAGHGTNLADLARIATIAADYDARCAQAVRIAIQTAGGGKDIQTLHQRLWEGVSEGDVHNAALNLGFAVGSLLLGKSDFESTMCGCAGLGGSSDQTCIATSTLLCLMHGAAPEDWTKPIGRELVFGHGLRDIDIPISIEDFANLIPSSELAIPTTLKVSSELQPIESADTDEEFSAEVPALATPLIDPSLSQRLIVLLNRSPKSNTISNEGLEVSCEYVGSCYVEGTQTLKLVARFENHRSEEIICDPTLRAPRDWNVAHKLASFRLPPKAVNEFPIVAQPTKELRLCANDKLYLDAGVTLEIPIQTPQRWYWVGPFANLEGGGFDAHYRPEDVWSVSEVFNGRSNLPIKWQELSVAGNAIDVERFFSSGAGVAFLFARLRLPAGSLRIVVAASVGVVVWIDRQQIIAYHDSHHPIARPVLPYVASFQAAEETTLLIKVLRNTVPLEPMIVYFLNDTGDVVTPLDSMPM